MALSCLISPSNILLGLAFLVWIAALVRGQAQFRWAWILAPLGLWALWSVISAWYSPERSFSLHALDNLPTLLLVPMTLSLLTPGRWKLLLRLLGGVSFLTSLIALRQTLATGIDLNNRAVSIFSHYMTFAGWTMAVMLILLGEALRAPREEREWWLWPLISFHAAMLVVSLTRNAWVGMAAAALLALMLWKPKPVMALPLVVVLIAALLPMAVRDRISSIVDLKQHANLDREAMIFAGLDMIRDHPLVGVGPDRIKTEYPSYRYPFAIRLHPSHLHDNPIHISAERGLPALAVYLAALLVFFYSAIRPLGFEPKFRVHRIAASAILAITGLTIAGLFEYNWGDAEIWILTLFLLGVPSGPRLEPEETEE